MPSRAARRRLLAVLLPGLLAALLWWTLLRSREIVETVAIGRGDIELSVTALGTLQPRSYVDVGAQASGAIRRIAVQAGSVVGQGALLVEIDPSLQQAKADADRAALDSLRAQLAQAEAQRELAQQEAERQRQMSADGATRMQDLQSAEAGLRVAVARAADLKAQIDGAQSILKGDAAQLGYTRIYAPMAGTVVTLDAREGQTLNATYQTPRLLRIADLSAMTVWTEVSEADVRRVRPGMPVYFTTLGTDRRWTATVRQILPAPSSPAPDAAADAQKSGGAPAAGRVVLYTVLFDVDNPDGALLPQMSAQVFFVEAAAHGVVLAPLTALQAADGADGAAGIYRAQVQLADGRIAAREVRTGVRDRLQAEVLSGLLPGDRLVTAIRHERAAEGRFRW